MQYRAVSNDDYALLCDQGKPNLSGRIDEVFVDAAQKALQQLKLHIALHHHRGDPRVANLLS
jgi:hypothetical protein